MRPNRIKKLIEIIKGCAEFPTNKKQKKAKKPRNKIERHDSRS